MLSYSRSCLLLLVAARLGAAAPGQTAPPPVASSEPAIELSPFVVDESSAQGYLATQTLNGTRINTAANFNALSQLPADSLLTSEWAFNAITRYGFAPESRLRGWSVGGNLRLRGRAVIGFAETAGVLDPTRPYYSDETADAGAFVAYRRRLGRHVDWSVQLNANGLFESGGLRAQRAVDPRDGTGVGRNVIFRVTEPRSFVLTSSLAY